ncbi:MAG TPA: histidine kinase dimerization/phosphoacceptor domain -containing protein [Rectinemataceae bacterium]|nr:histidine kinase dimerization/phosphoacceptor domain -containing protein [Rectinemataceae bacterium]
MKIYSIPSLIIATVCLTIAISDTLAWVRRSKRKGDLAFILTCVGGATFNLFCSGEYNVDSPLQSVFWLKGETIASAISGFALFWFIAEETLLVKRRYVLLCLLWAMLASLTQVLNLGDLTWIASRPFVLRVPLPFGLDFVYREVERGPILVAITSIGFLFLVYLLVNILKFRRLGRRSESAVFIIALGFVIAAQIIDFLIGVGIFHFVFLLEYAWLGTILVVGLRRSNDFIEAGIAKRALQKTDLELKESQATLSTIIDSTSDMIWSVDVESFSILTFNSSFREQVSKVSGIVVAPGMPLNRLLPSEEELGQWRGIYRRAIEEGAYSFELSMPAISKDLHLSVNPLRQDGRLFGLSVFGHDISERKKAEAQIRRALAEKSILLQEVFHRTKNNMSVIIAMLRLQANQIGDDKLKKAYGIAIDRIISMSLVHDKLYQTDDLSSIDLKAYLKDLANRLIASYAAPERRPSLVLDMDSVNVALETAISCGQIANELVTNSLKYAFPDDRIGEIKVQLKRNVGNEISLTISDDGIGVPPGFAFARDGHLGLRLVNSLAHGRLHARVEFTTDRGLSCRLQFADQEGR